MIKKCSILFGVLLVASASFAVEVEIDSATQQLTRRIFMLETALAPANPKAVASAWANAEKSRNGAVQYMLMCPDLQKENVNNLDELNWVTGVSSPWITNVKIISQKKNQTTWKFDIQYTFSTGGGSAGSAVDHIDVVHVNDEANLAQKYCISQFGYLSPASML
jgi:hypothetical protein